MTLPPASLSHPSSRFISAVRRLPPFSRLFMFNLTLLGGWLVLFSETLSFTWNWDDYHLIRPFTCEEIFTTFHGHWDPDQLETKGYRPLTVLFNHTRAVLFGENLRLHRIGQGLLGALVLSLWGTVALEAGCRWSEVLLASMLIWCTKVLTMLLVWLTDGALLFGYLWIAAAAWAHLRWLHRGGYGFLAAVWVSSFLAIFTREEAYLLPVILAGLWLGSPRRRMPLLPALLPVGCAMAIVLLHMALRGRFVPGALSPALSPEGLWRIWVALLGSMRPFGLLSLFSPPFSPVWNTFLAALVLCAFLYVNESGLRKIAWVMMLTIGLTLPALGMFRSNLILLPSAAFMLTISITFRETVSAMFSAAGALPRWKVWCLLVYLGLGLLAGMAGGLWRARLQAASLHPNSAIKVVRESGWVITNSKAMTCPPDRRKDLLQYLADRGVRTPEDVTRLERDISSHSDYLINNREKKEGLFLPAYDMLDQ